MADLLRHWKLAILWALSLVAVGAISSLAQAQRPSQPPGLQFNVLTESPTVVSGNDVGFRIERTQDGILIGRLVVRVDGRWVDTGVPAR
jgi:hypothetical protein